MPAFLSEWSVSGAKPVTRPGLLMLVNWLREDDACVIISQWSVRILQNKDAFLRITLKLVCFKAGTRTFEVCAVSREATQVVSFKARVMS